MKQFRYGMVADPKYYRVNAEDAHSDHVAYESQKALSSGVSAYRESLNGIWKFHYAKTYKETVTGFEKPSYDCGTWDDIRVPAHIQMEGYDIPAYVNVQYPWDGTEDIGPGEIPLAFNPVASYVKEFLVPERMKGKPLHIVFDGVESGFALWCNGDFVGYAEDSFTPSEFDLTPYLKRGKNKLAVQVFKWTSGSWLEDQDFYRFSGIFRDVYLMSIPEVHVKDITIRTHVDDDYRDAVLEVVCKMRLAKKEAQMTYALIKDGKEVIEGSRKLTGSVTLKLPVKAPLLWSAEDPQLYELRLMFLNARGKVVEVVSEHVGFRRFEMKDGLMCLNGKRIVFHGVNRHEFSWDKGRVPDFDETLSDVRTMKKNNINAVRTCHYPDASYIYHLCDIFGLYMIAETNLETHGIWDMIARGKKPVSYALPGNRREYLPVVLDRANNNYQTNKNHPSVLIWSLGNESFGGKDLVEMTKFFHRVDPERLVHYEGVAWDPRYPEATDMYSQMYTPAADVKKYIRTHKEKPFILCEYAHAMANSCGALYKYTDLEVTEKRYQGGFIWDFVDQAIRKQNRYGEWYAAYGGDCTERPTDYAFCGNGIVDASRRPYDGKMQEVKYCYQMIRIDVDGRDVTIDNRYLFTGTDQFDCVVTLARDGALILQMPVRMDVPPMTKKIFRLPLARQRESGEYTVTVSFRLKQDTAWAEKGHEIAFGQDVYRVSARISFPEKTHRLVDGVNTIGVHGGHFSVLFSRAKGAIVSYKYAGREVIAAPPHPDFWRAPTDNDYGNRMPFRYHVWKTASLYQEAFVPSESRRADDRAMAHLSPYPVIREAKFYTELSFVRYLATSPVTNVTVTYRVFSDGTVRVLMDYVPDAALPPMPAFGMRFTLDADYDRMVWYGMGPEECYVDRDKGARLGVYAVRVPDNLTPYLVPQECGNRTGVRWMKVTDAQDRGLLFTGDAMEASALPYTPEQLEEASHPYELPPVHHTIVRCNLMQMGIAGDDGWGARTHDEFLLSNTEPLHFEMAFRGI